MDQEVAPLDAAHTHIPSSLTRRVSRLSSLRPSLSRRVFLHYLMGTNPSASSGILRLNHDLQHILRDARAPIAGNVNHSEDQQGPQPVTHRFSEAEWAQWFHERQRDGHWNKRDERRKPEEPTPGP
jgi:hypothetical protein